MYIFRACPKTGTTTLLANLRGSPVHYTKPKLNQVPTLISRFLYHSPRSVHVDNHDKCRKPVLLIDLLAVNMSSRCFFGQVVVHLIASRTVSRDTSIRKVHATFINDHVPIDYMVSGCRDCASLSDG